MLQLCLDSQKAPLLCRAADNKEFEEVKDQIPKDSKFLWFSYDVGSTKKILF